MDGTATGALAAELRKVANRIAELPGIRWLTKPVYRRHFARQNAHRNMYYGLYQDFAQAKAHAPRSVPTHYDTLAAGGLYRNLLNQLRATDYPALYWMSRFFEDGARNVFDLGGHIGTSYYAFGPYLRYPEGLRWLVHDVPAVIDAGQDWAREHDKGERLGFSACRDDADGCDVLFSSGALQYLDYTLPELLQRLPDPPTHVLVNRVPMHPSRSYFTLQNLGIAICPYRVSAVPEFVTGMQSLGYVCVDHWECHERSLRVPFERGTAIDSYHGFCFRLG